MGKDLIIVGSNLSSLGYISKGLMVPEVNITLWYLAKIGAIATEASKQFS
jgi:hypothetical protein